ncbi:hypothetical protein SNE40_015216 [Patella caerulea]|uniref:TELO2-interacting protein 1 homolog n=1 Tax=Patella caerulea TaxID=87958 RepID=A0AAN8PRR9_PATCE
MASDEEKSRAFNRLKPLCVTVTKQPCRESIQRLHQELKATDQPLLQDLQEYVLFPLRLVFKQVKTIQQDVYIDVCECMMFIFNGSKITNWQMFTDLFTTFSCMISSPHDSLPVIASCEELKLVILKTLTALVVNTEWSVLKILYEPKSLPALGHAVSVVLKEAEVERSRDLQITAIVCMCSLAQINRKLVKSERLLLGDVFASFLPGITMTLSRIITGDQKQGQAVLVKAIDTWTRITSLVMSDEAADITETKNGSLKTNEVDEKIRGLMIKRNKDWLTSTSSKLLILIKQITTVKTHSNWRVRLALVEWADLLLKKCCKSMKECVPALLEVLVGLIGDDYKNIKTKSLESLNGFKQKQKDVCETRALQEILSDNLHSLTTSLPRQIHMADEDGKLAIVNLLNGYLTLLGPDINQVFKSIAHLRRLSLSLIQALEFDCTDIRIIEHKSQSIVKGGIPSEADIMRPKHVFKHFRDNQITTALIQSCHLLGQHGDIDLLVDHMMDLLHESSIYQLQSVFIINQIIAGSVTKENVSLVVDIIRMLVDEYLSDDNFNIPTSTPAQCNTQSNQESSPLWLNKGNNSSLTLANMNHNIMKICLLIEGVGIFAKVLGADFRCLLMDVVYPLLEKLGQDNTYISHTAYYTLTEVSTACHYSSIDELIRKNSDYLVNTISLKLRRFHHDNHAPLVLQVMIEYSSVELLPLIHDTVQEILETLDNNYEDKSSVFLQVLKELVVSILRWFPFKDKENTKEKNYQSESDLASSLKQLQQDRHPESKKSLTLKQIEEYFIDYHKTKQIADGNIDDIDSGDTVDNDDIQDENQKGNSDKKDLPFHVTAVKEILLRTKHLMSCNNPRLRLLVLDIIQYSIQVLYNYQDELLPMLHEIWLPFALRFSDDEKLVTVKAMETLRLMSDCSGDFLMKRTIKDIIPSIKRFLENQAKISYHCGSMYTFTVNYKLQLTFLTNLGQLALKLQIHGNDLNLVTSCCLPYLNTHQPQTLQAASVNCFRDFTKLDKDVIWFTLNNLYTPQHLTPPSPAFTPIQFNTKASEENEYSRNVKMLLPFTEQSYS